MQQGARKQPRGRTSAQQAKPFPVTKRQVWDAWKRVKANQGGAGIDEQSIADFEENLADNLYKIWNRMASGSYYPKPVRRVNIPKPGGGIRPLGIPTVADRVAQMVVKQALELVLEREFHPDSYGYRPNKSAHDALRQTRMRCWKWAWVLDMDIKLYFDTIDHALLMKAVRRHTDQKWVLLYIERWLTAPVIHPDGTEAARDVGTPQGGVISPLLANLFLHYSFDKWMERNYPQIPFERYADDIVCHCTSEAQARELWQVLKGRFTACNLMLHPEKTRIVYCKATGCEGTYADVSFDFLGYTFRPRKTKGRGGKIFLGFNPAISRKAAKAIRETIHSWGLARMSPLSMEQIAGRINAVVRGWITYYGAFFKSELSKVLLSIDEHLIRWMMRKYKRFRGHWRRSWRWVRKIARQNSGLFVHWTFLYGSPLFNSKRLHGKRFYSRTPYWLSSMSLY